MTEHRHGRSRVPLACLRDAQVPYGGVAALQGVGVSLQRGEVLALRRRLRRIG